MHYVRGRTKVLGVPDMNVTKLQKLLWIVYGVVLTHCCFRICDESPEAGTYGPIFRKTLKFLSCYGIDYTVPLEDIGPKLPQEIREAVDVTLRYFGRFAGNQLVNWTTGRNTPWHRVVHDELACIRQIPDSWTFDWFREHVLKKPETEEQRSE